MKYKKLNSQQHKRLIKKLNEYPPNTSEAFDGGTFHYRGEYILISRPANSKAIPKSEPIIKNTAYLLYQDYKKEVVAFKVKGCDTKKTKKGKNKNVR